MESVSSQLDTGFFEFIGAKDPDTNLICRLSPEPFGNVIQNSI